MQIIKNGNPLPDPWYFECKSCGCIWISENIECIQTAEVPPFRGSRSRSGGTVKMLCPTEGCYEMCITARKPDCRARKK